MGPLRHAWQRLGMGRGRLARQLQGSAGRRLGLDDIHAMFDAAEREGLVGVARKSRLVDVRSAVPGEAFTAPWSEAMVARPGDVIVRDPANRNDTYRVAALSFECTYEIIEAAESRP